MPLSTITYTNLLKIKKKQKKKNKNNSFLCYKLQTILLKFQKPVPNTEAYGEILESA